jgi:hypothetical protein
VRSAPNPDDIEERRMHSRTLSGDRTSERLQRRRSASSVKLQSEERHRRQGPAIRRDSIEMRREQRNPEFRPLRYARPSFQWEQRPRSGRTHWHTGGSPAPDTDSDTDFGTENRPRRRAWTGFFKNMGHGKS